MSKVVDLAETIRMQVRNQARREGIDDSMLNDWALGYLSMTLASRQVPVCKDGKVEFVYFRDVEFNGESYVRTRG